MSFYISNLKFLFFQETKAIKILQKLSLMDQKYIPRVSYKNQSHWPW